MATLYTQQNNNVQKTWLLMTVFFAIVVGVAWFLSQYYGNPIILVVGVVFSLVMNITSYWFSDKIALSLSHAISADPVRHLELVRIVENLSITAGLPAPRVYIIADNAPNAFATGRDPEHSAVAVTEGLLSLLNKTELEGVIAHELSHIGNRDILLSTVVVVLVGLLSILADITLRSNFHGSRRSDNKNNPLMILGIIAVILSPIIATLLQLAISRKREFLADASGALLTRYPEGLASALEKIAGYGVPMTHASHATAHLFISDPFASSAASKSGGFLNTIFSTHPKTEDRVKALREQ
ncbi:zinc metalloprotease HtpX [Patescibacteria group bacterium]|nr:MAG: zinc metalloprotease HtpX [Patescibacteria group bacterium]